MINWRYYMTVRSTEKSYLFSDLHYLEETQRQTAIKGHAQVLSTILSKSEVLKLAKSTWLNAGPQIANDKGPPPGSLPTGHTVSLGPGYPALAAVIDRLRIFTEKDVSGQISGPSVVSSLGSRPPVSAKS